MEFLPDFCNGTTTTLRIMLLLYRKWKLFVLFSLSFPPLYYSLLGCHVCYVIYAKASSSPSGHEMAMKWRPKKLISSKDTVFFILAVI